MHDPTRMALIMAGLGAWTPGGIAGGLQQGMQLVQHQQSVDMQAKKLEQEANFHNDQYTRETVGQKSTREMGERKQQLEEMKPVQVGQDDYGRPIMAKRNPKTGEYEVIKQDTTPQFEQPASPGSSSSPGSPGTSAPTPTTTAATGDSVLPVNATPTEGLSGTGAFPGDIGGAPSAAPAPGTNQDVLAGMKPADALKVRAIAEGRQRFLPQTRNNPYNRYIMDKVMEYDPGADEGAFTRRSRTQNFFAVGTQGGGGQNIASMNTFGQHADELMRLSKELNLGRFKDWNEVKNWMGRHGYTSKEVQDKLGAWDVAQKAIADEGAKVFAGTNSSLADRSAWEEKFDASNPASVTATKLKEVVKLIEGRLNSLAGQYNDGMRTGHQPAEFIKPRTQEIFDRINKGEAAPPAAKTAPAAAAPAAAAKPDPATRFKQLRAGGMSEDDAYKALHKEGY